MLSQSKQSISNCGGLQNLASFGVWDGRDPLSHLNVLFVLYSTVQYCTVQYTSCCPEWESLEVSLFGRYCRLAVA